MPRNRRWSREELVLALDLYFKIGASYKTHPDVIDLSECLNRLSDAGLEADSNRFRNPSGVAMQLGNFARLDGNYSGAGLTHGGRLEQVVWDEFSDKRTELVSEATNIKSSFSYNPVVEAKAIVGGQGFSPSSPKRKALELAAMNQASKYYSSQGWQVDDVSANRPYDLSCTNSTGTELHVEVKGTTGDGSSVLLTPNEVRHARQYANVDLYVLSGLILQTDVLGNVDAVGGKQEIYSPWNINSGTLNAIGYEYSPP